MALSLPETPPASHSTTLRQVLSVCQRHPVEQKIVFVPYQQVGRAITSGVGCSAHIVGGLQCVTPTAYARRVLEERHPSSSNEHILPAASQQMLVGEILESVDDLDTRPSPGQGIADLCNTLTTLRLAEVHPRDLDAMEGKAGALLRTVYSRYVAELDDRDLWDEATVFRKAADLISTGEDSVWPVLGICSEVDMHAASRRFLDALLSAGSTGYLFQTEYDHAAPPTVAGNLLRPEVEEGRTSVVSTDGSVDGDTPVEVEKPEASSVHVQEAVGPVREIRSVLRAILSGDTHFEDVEVAYTTSTPYLPLLVDEAERAGIPTTCGTGLPVSSTLPGQLLIRFCRWIEEGYPAADLVDMLRGGLLRTGAWMKDQTENDGKQTIGAKDLTYVSAHRLATIFAESRFGNSLDAYETILSERMQVQKDEIERLESADAKSGRPEQRHAELETTLHFICELRQHLPNTTSVSTLSDAFLQLLERFGPWVYTDAARKDREEGDESDGRDSSRTYDQIARNVLVEDVLPSLKEADAQVEYNGQPLADVARFIRRHLEQQYVGAEEPSPGHIHILPLDSAGFSGRSDLYVVGMDSESTDMGAVADPLLGDAERDRLGTVDAPLKRSRHEAEASAWRAQVAIARHHGRQQFCTSVFDPVDGEERFPSTLFLAQVDRTEHGDSNSLPIPRETLVPSASPKDQTGPTSTGTPIFLSDAEAWLAAQKSPETGDGQDARTLLFKQFPWIEHGETARRMRASDEYTEYDGLLSPGTYPDLDIFREDTPTVSANRLQMFATAPYAYFVQYVLGVKKRVEPAVDDEPWLTALRKGSILHEAFDRMMTDHGDLIGTDQAQDALYKILREEVKRHKQTVHLSSAGRQNVLDALRTPARVFLQSENVRAGRFTPHRFEWGFGHPPERRKEGDAETVLLEFQSGHDPLPVCGRIDRIDIEPASSETGEDALWIWDYKSGSTSSFDVSDPLQKGKKLQWLLYAQIAHQVFDEPVVRSGYFFPDVKETGVRLDYPVNAGYRMEMEDILKRLGEMSRTGTFPMNPKVRKTDAWKYGDYDALFPDLEKREAQLDAKRYPEGDDRKMPIAFED